MSQLYRGVVVPMVSPFTPDFRADLGGAGRIVERLLAGKVAGIFPLGTTGESASIPAREKLRLVEAVAEAVNGRATLYAGISGNCLTDSLAAANAFASLGVRALVAHPPSYFPLSDGEIETYFRRLADEMPLPLVLYNIPITTHHNIPIDAVARLSEHANVVAIKDSSGDRERITQLLGVTGGRGGFPVLLGSSALFTHGLRAGGVGLVPSGGHLVAAEYQAMYDAAMRDDWSEVERLQGVTDAAAARYLKGRSLGQSLAALKAILESDGVCGRTMMPPLLDHEGVPS